MSEESDSIYLKGFSTKKFLSFFLFFFLGIAASFLANAFIPYVQKNQILMFVIFPVISLPLCLYALTLFPKCQKCGTKTKPAPTKRGSERDNLVCKSCGQKYQIDALTRG